MRRLILALLSMACGSEELHLPPPALAVAEAWIAWRSDEGRWSLIPFDDATSPLRISDAAEAMFLGYDQPTGLPLDRPASRDDLARANCVVTSPSEAWALGLEPAPSWERAELPAPLQGILRALARPDCEICPEFELTPVVLAPSGGGRAADVQGLVALPSGAALVLRPVAGLMRIGRDARITPLTGCPEALQAVDGPSQLGHYWGASLSQLFELSISEDESSCLVERSVEIPEPLSLLAHLKTSGPTDGTEGFIMGLVTPQTWIVLHFDGTAMTQVLELPRMNDDDHALSRLGPRDALVTNQSVALRWTEGSSTQLELPGVDQITGFSIVPGFGVFAFGRTPLSSVAIELDLARNVFLEPVSYGEYADRMSVTAPFRAGMIGLHRGGEIVQFHDRGNSCLSPTEVGDANHVPGFAVSYSDERWITDNVASHRGPTVTWFQAMPPPVPPPDQF